MSMTRELIKELRDLQNDGEIDCYGNQELMEVCKKAADTIEELSSKLHISQMERSSQYYHGGWIPCDERLPECQKGAETDALMYQTKSGYIEVGYYGTGGRYRDKYFRTYRDSYEGVDARDVVAWRPLPEPYNKTKA